jgi:hypothetical protein
MTIINKLKDEVIVIRDKDGRIFVQQEDFIGRKVQICYVLAYSPKEHGKLQFSKFARSGDDWLAIGDSQFNNTYEYEQWIKSYTNYKLDWVNVRL